eukprot:187771-Rhodomonas_salina.1
MRGTEIHILASARLLAGNSALSSSGSRFLNLPPEREVPTIPPRTCPHTRWAVSGADDACPASARVRRWVLAADPRRAWLVNHALVLQTR